MYFTAVAKIINPTNIDDMQALLLNALNHKNIIRLISATISSIRKDTN